MARKPTKHYFIRDGYIHVCGTRKLIERLGGIPPDNKKYYRRTTELPATEENIRYIEAHAVEVLLHIVAKKRTNSEIFGKYAFEVLRQTAQSRSTGTQKEYISMVKRFMMPYFEHHQLREITHSDLRNWQNALLEEGASKDRVRRVANVFRMILEEAVYDAQIDTNPFNRVRLVKKDAPKPKVPYTIDEIERIIAHSRGWFRTYFVVSIMTGLRPKEVRELKWSDISFRQKEISVFQTKTGRYKRVPLIYACEQALISLQKDRQTEWVFPSEHGKPFTDGKNINKYHFKPLLEELGIEYKSLHVTRHMFASILISNGIDINWVSKVMGHASIETTLKYYNIFSGETRFHENANIANNIIKSTFSLEKKKES